ncbi:unnamed protein product [Gadus morhua 'NCC']
MLAGILLANGNISASILNSLYNENLVKEGVSAAFAVKLFKSWIYEKDINCVACSLRKVGMDNRLMELFPANKRSAEHFSSTSPTPASRSWPTLPATSCRSAPARSCRRSSMSRWPAGTPRERSSPTPGRR